MYEFISTTNERFKYLEGRKGSLVYDEQHNVFWFDVSFHTSLVKDIVDKDDIKTITTLNSVYVFKKIKDNK